MPVILSVTFGNVQNSFCTFFLHPNMIYFVHSIVLYIFIGVCKTLQTQISSAFECDMKVLYNSREFFSSLSAALRLHKIDLC